MIEPEHIGYMAGFCTTIAFLPQVIQVWKTRSVDDISLGMYSLLVFGVLLWLIYAIYLQSLPMLLPNIVTLCLSSTVLAFKIRQVCKS